MEKLEQYMEKLPIIPEVASKILSLGDDGGNMGFDKIEEIISIDPMLTSRILKVANSSLYARQKEITTIQMALGLLGLKNIKSLVLLLAASRFSSALPTSDFYNNFWKHSILCAFVARELSFRKRDRNGGDKIFSVALLHDLGRVLLYHADPDQYSLVIQRVDKGISPLLEAERELFKLDHREAGGALLEHWNLPAIFIDAARMHGKKDITSVNKSLILRLNGAHILSSHIMGERDEEIDPSDESIFLDLAGVDEEQKQFFYEEYRAILEEDPLFKQCESLFIR